MKDFIMAKDPAFLFYSKDFYEGTRLMLPDERACLVDLMIYQHQNGGIPNDPKRLSLYCSGISEETIKSTLELKFKLINNEWYSERMSEVTSERYEKGRKNKLIGTFGYILKKMNYTSKQVKLLRSKFNIDELLEKSSEWDSERYSERLTEWCQKAIAVIEDEDEDANEDLNEDLNKIKKGVKDFESFWDSYHSISGTPKTDKEAALKYWKKLTSSEKEKAIANIQDYVNSVSSPKYIKKARTYLSDKNFNDEFGEKENTNQQKDYNYEEIFSE